MKIKGGADAKKQGGFQPLPVLGHELLLLGSAEPYPKDVRPERLEPVRQVLFFDGGQRAERGGEGADDSQSWDPSFEAQLKLLGDSGGAAIQKMSQAAGTGAATHLEHQVRAIDPPHLPEPPHFSDPNHRHAVRGVQKRSVEDSAKSGVAPGFGDSMHTSDAHVAPVSLLERLANEGERRIQVDGADAHAQDVHPGGRAHFWLVYHGQRYKTAYHAEARIGTKMKLLVFAHTPPPHHGQSYMVQLMLAGFGGDHRAARGAWARNAAGPPSGVGAGVAPETALGIECYHVNARLSQKLEDIGDFRIGKFLLLLGYSAQAIWCRFRYGVTTLYYIPAPGKRSALYRDWLVMLLCRPFFRRIILHWHAAGLAKWLETVVQLRSRALTYRLMKRVDLSIVLSKFNQADAEKLFSRRIVVVNNGIPDPCPNFTEDVLPRRKGRLAARQKLLAGTELTPADLQASGGDPHLFKVLYLAHCTREKGLFDTLDAVALANRMLAQAKSPIVIQLSVAGDFINAAERQEFQQRLAQEDLRLPAGGRKELQHFRVTVANKPGGGQGI